MIILSWILFTIKACVWLTVLAFVIAAFRLFILGLRLKYTESITDISILKKGDIILTGKRGVFYSPFIQLSNVMSRKIKHRFWTHAAIYRGEDGLLWEALPKGVVEGNINDYIKKGFLIRAFRHRYITDEKMLEKVLDFCAIVNQKGYKYGWIGLIFYTFSTFTPISFNFIFDNFIVNKWCNLDNAYFCSELVVDAFRETGYPVSPFDGWRVKPSDFISNPILDPVKVS